MHRITNSRRARHGVDSTATLSGSETASIRSKVIATVIQADIILVLVKVTKGTMHYKTSGDSFNILALLGKTVTVRGNYRLKCITATAYTVVKSMPLLRHRVCSLRKPKGVLSLSTRLLFILLKPNDSRFKSISNWSKRIK